MGSLKLPYPENAAMAALIKLGSGEIRLKPAACTQRTIGDLALPDH